LQGGWSGEDIVRYVQKSWGIHIDISGKVGSWGSKGMDRCPLTAHSLLRAKSDREAAQNLIIDNLALYS
jgi:hypothetical protein